MAHPNYRGYPNQPPQPPRPYSGHQQHPNQQPRGYTPPGGYRPQAPGYGPPARAMPQPHVPPSQAARPPAYPQPPSTRQPYPPASTQPPPNSANPPAPRTIDNRKQSLSEVRLQSDKIKSLSTSELTEIKENEGKFMELFAALQPDIPDLVRMKQDRQKTQESNRSLATQTLASQPQYEELYQELLDSSERYQAQQGLYQSAYDKMVTLVSKFELSEMNHSLEKLTTQSEEEGEALVESFLAGRASYEEFSCRYIDLRKDYWLRKVKLEKLEEYRKHKPPSQPTPYPPGGGGIAPVPSPRRRQH